jgi:hypothetical protein
MWYYRRNRWNRRRGPGRFWFLPLLFFFFMFGGIGREHSLFGLIIPILVLLFLFWLIRTVMSAGRWNAMNQGQRYQQPYYQPPQQPYSQPYYQPSQQPYQQPVDRPYEQGYQPVAGTYSEGGQQYQYPEPSYEQYEQPQAQYPQELPPMEQ